MMYPLACDLAAEGIPVAAACRVLEFSTQAYYAWLANPVSDRDIEDAYLINDAMKIHAADPTLGYRFIADELRRRGHRTSETRVWRLCSQQRIFAVHATKKARGPRSGPPVHDDLVRRNFHADKPNHIWLTDITEHPTNEGKLYLCAVKDVWSNRIVGYSMASHMETELALTALRNAALLRHHDGTIVHSDRGSQFRSHDYCREIAILGMKGSMGQVACCADNAAMESFFSLLQKNVLDTQTWDSRDQLRAAIVSWIEISYHRRRRQRALGKLTPIEYELIMTK